MSLGISGILRYLPVIIASVWRFGSGSVLPSMSVEGTSHDAVLDDDKQLNMLLLRTSLQELASKRMSRSSVEWMAVE